MQLRGNIKKILFLSLVLVVSAGLLVLLIAAINKKGHSTCNGAAVTIHSANTSVFLNKQDVLAIIAPGKDNQPKGKPLSSFDLKKIEAALKQNVWVGDAQLFFDNNDILQVTVEERTPVARIFTVNGNSFYIDSAGKRLPLNNRMTIKLPVFSNFPSDKETLYGADSLLLEQVRKMSPFILSSPFWMAQIAQIDITPNRSFEMLPVVGKHIIAFGDGEDYVKKFQRLYLFYRQVAAKAGMDKYSVINVQYDQQVVATRKGPAGKIDSLQAIKNIKKLIEASRQIAADTLSTTVDNNIVANAAPSPTLTILKEQPSNTSSKDSFHHVPTSASPPPLKSRASLPSAKHPKAVMKRKSG